MLKVIKMKDYSKKIKLCEKLGAKSFQKIVFFIEHIKFKTLKILFPNYINLHDKRCDSKRNKELNKVHSEITKKEIIDKYRNYKIIARKEINLEQNRNYHIDKNNPTGFINYLNWNKDIHVKGLITNFIAIPILTFGIVSNITILIPFLIFELISTFINFECINIQNYNIYRFKQKEETLKIFEQRNLDNKIKKYKEASNVIEKAKNETINIPSVDDIIRNISTKEQLTQLRNMITEAKSNYDVTGFSKTKKGRFFVK